MGKKVVIVGGNGAGLSAGSQIKRLKPDYQVVVLEKGKYVSYGPCGIPYYLGGIIRNFNRLFSLTPEKIKERNMDLRLFHEVVGVNPEGKKVTVKTEEEIWEESFDYLVIASGANPTLAGMEVEGAKRIFLLRDLIDMQAISRLIEKENPRKCGVLGAGYIAVEMLEAFKSRGLETHLVHRRNSLSKTFEKETSDLIMDKMDKEGIVLNLDTNVKELVEEKNGVTVKTDKGDLEFDFILLAFGIEPNTGFLKDSSLELGVKNSLVVNKKMQTNYDYIYAAGDCAQTTNLITGNPDYVALAPKANKEGLTAGQNICGQPEEFPGVIGTAITRSFDLGVSRTGLSLEEAQKLFPQAIKYTLTTPTKSHYFPGAGDLHSIIIVNKEDQRILGAQLVGPLDAVKRIDLYSTIITSGMNLSQAFDLDFSYGPPFSTLYDPVTTAMRVGKKMVE